MITDCQRRESVTGTVARCDQLCSRDLWVLYLFICPATFPYTIILMIPKRVGQSFLYEQVANKITQLISQGTIRPGERVPSVRKISHQQRISISTALQAYFLLENQGLIEARPQSGFYVRAQCLRLPPEPQDDQSSLTATRVGVDELVAKVIEAARNPTIISLGAR